MTTIAYKDGILAADTCLTLSENIKSYCHKIYRIPKTDASPSRVWAAAGDAEVIEDWKMYLTGESKKKPAKAKNMAGIFIIDKNAYFFDSSPILMPIEKSFHSEGSGWQIAFAGMHMGLSAVDAVKLAGEIEVNTNSLVDYYNVETQEYVETTFPD